MSMIIYLRVDLGAEQHVGRRTKNVQSAKAKTKADIGFAVTAKLIAPLFS